MDNFISDEVSIIARPCDDFHRCYEFMIELRDHGIIKAVLHTCAHSTEVKAKRLIDTEDSNNVS